MNDQRESPAAAAARVIADNGMPADDFNGDTPHLVNCMRALVNLSDAGALVPHRLPGHARTLLLAAASRLDATRGVDVPLAPSDLKLALHQLHQLAAHFHGTNADDGQCNLALNFLSQFDEDGNRTRGVNPSQGGQ